MKKQNKKTRLPFNVWYIRMQLLPAAFSVRSRLSQMAVLPWRLLEREIGSAWKASAEPGGLLSYQKNKKHR